MAPKVIKRKGVAQSAANPFGRKATASKKLDEENEVENEVPEEDMEEENDAEEVEEETEETPEEKIKREEAEITNARKKELKSMYIDDLKKTVTGYQLDLAKKELMITSVLAHEAKQRADKREHEDKVREVVVKKKAEFEGISAPELKKLCDAADIKGQLSKKDRVERLLTKWLADDGVNKAFAQLAYDTRCEELGAMDKLALRKLCEGAGVDPFVKEVIVDRIIKHEAAAGRFDRPTPPSEQATQEVKGASVKKGSIVDNLLAEEADRKKQLEKQKQQDEKTLSLMKELKAMPLEQLKKELSKRKLEPSGKKEDLIVSLYEAREKEAALVARKAELKGCSKDELKNILAKHGLEPSKSKDDMVEAVMQHEQKLQSEVKEYESKVEEVVSKIKEDLRSKSARELKDMCASKGLKAGVGLEDRVERLGEHAKTSGEVATIVSNMARDARREALTATDKVELTKRCDQEGLDALIKDIMIERVLEHESDNGPIQGPPAKKARK